MAHRAKTDGEGKGRSDVIRVDEAEAKAHLGGRLR
jgi:hypothetical protein